MPGPKPSGLVNVKVLAGGSELPGTFQVNRIQITKTLNKVSSATIHFLDGNPSIQKFEISDKADLEPGAEIEIKAGYDSDSESLFKGIIIKHGIKVQSGSTFTIIECKDKAVLMTIENRSDIFEKKKDSEIMQTLISRHSGVSAKVDATDYQHPQILQYNATDWDFVMARAEANSKVVYTLDNKVGVVTPKVASPKMTLEFGTNIIDFEANINADTQLSKVKAISWNIKSQEVAQKEVSSADFEETGSLKSAGLAGKVKTDGQLLSHPGALDVGELGDWGKAVMLRSKMGKLTGTVKANGFAGINPNDTLELKGFGKKFNGKVYVASVEHSIDAGKWFTSIKFGLNPELHVRKFDIGSQQASGLLPAVHGLQIGIVKKIHEDPDNQHRVQVSLVSFGSSTNVWARRVFPDAGKERGVYWMPEIGDEVVIGFMNDDARYPIIIGNLHSSKNKPPYVTDAKNKEKGIVTREKLKLTFNDEDKITTWETPAKQSIEINDKEESIVIKDKQGNTITLKKDLIELKGMGEIKITAMKDVTISGQNIKIDAKLNADIGATNIKNTAKAQFKAAGNAGAEISSGAQTVVKGGAMVQIQGALVKIN
ncbi:MAG TPA: hypothetical protein DCQ31_04140 [Bacteroidales bacterium]|nr:hypothetical protein [Bacteroidales bacterium]